MTLTDEFKFLNSEIWLKYTQLEYKTTEEIKYRLDEAHHRIQDWDEVKKNITRYRKAGSIPLFLNSIEKEFWFYPSDCIYQKAHEIEKAGIALYESIARQKVFAAEFLFDATIEEAITSAIYEGANSTRAKAKEFIETEAKPKNKDEWMLFNNYKAMEWIKKNDQQEITTDVIKKIHEIVTRNTMVGDDGNFSDKFRNDRVFVISGNDTKHEGTDFNKIEFALNEAIDLVIKNQRYFPALLKGMLMHYFISYIHPFFDGNGRTARTLFYFQSIKSNLKFIEMLSVSAYLKNHGKQYERSFEKVANHDLDITYFIDYNLNALKVAQDNVLKKIDFLLKINDLKDRYTLSAQQIELLQKMALHKFKKYDIESYAKSINKSREIARQDLKKLTGLGFLEEIKEGKKFLYRIRKEKLEADLLQK